MEPILKVEGLTKIFSSKGREDYMAVDGVSFSMMAGEKLAIIGECGSGKSSVVNMVGRVVVGT